MEKEKDKQEGQVREAGRKRGQRSRKIHVGWRSRKRMR
jgi:hypothetical protein